MCDLGDMCLLMFLSVYVYMGMRMCVYHEDDWTAIKSNLQN